MCFNGVNITPSIIFRPIQVLRDSLAGVFGNLVERKLEQPIIIVSIIGLIPRRDKVDALIV